MLKVEKCYFKPLIEEPVEVLAQETERLVIEETTETAADSSKQVTTLNRPQDRMSDRQNVALTKCLYDNPIFTRQFIYRLQILSFWSFIKQLTKNNLININTRLQSFIVFDTFNTYLFSFNTT